MTKANGLFSIDGQVPWSVISIMKMNSLFKNAWKRTLHLGKVINFKQKV